MICDFLFAPIEIGNLTTLGICNDENAVHIGEEGGRIVIDEHWRDVEEHDARLVLRLYPVDRLGRRCVEEYIGRVFHAMGVQ